jgi:hypothetical protein
MWQEIFRNILWVIVFLIVVVAFFAVIFKVSDWKDIASAQLTLESFITSLDEAKTSFTNPAVTRKEITLELPSIVDKIEIVSANTGKGKNCLSQTCTHKCLESPYYIFVTFSGKNNPKCIEKYLCCDVQFIEKSLLGTTTSSSIGGKISYTMQVSYDAEKQTFNTIVTSSKDKDWGVQLNDARRSIFG